jgi:hypothetical protein
MSSSTAKKVPSSSYTVAPATSPRSSGAVLSINPSSASVSSTWTAATNSLSPEPAMKEVGSVALTTNGLPSSGLRSSS